MQRRLMVRDGSQQCSLVTYQYGWSLGIPLVRKLDTNLWEVQSDITNKDTARILFNVSSTLI